VSSSLYYRPPQPKPEGYHLGYALKWALAGKYYDHDGSLTTDWFTLSQRDISFLEGVAAAGSDETKKEAMRTINLIKKHGSIEVRLSA
jgi:hypothetical protein